MAGVEGAGTRSEAFRRFQHEDWESLTLRLVKYAIYRVRRLEWKTGSFLPKGVLPEDLALDAIRKTCEGLVAAAPSKGMRWWDPEKHPDLFAYLKGVVDSDVHALVTSAEHKLTHYSPGLTSDDAALYSERLIDSCSLGGPFGGASRSAEELMIQRERALFEQERFNRLMEDLYRMCADDKEELLILMAYQETAQRHERVKPGLVAKYAGLDEKSARNAIRRLARKVGRRRCNRE